MSLLRLGIDNLHASAQDTHMETTRTYTVNGQSKTFAEMTLDEKVQVLAESMARNEARKINTPSIFNKAPKDGWTDADRIAK